MALFRHRFITHNYRNSPCGIVETNRYMTLTRRSPIMSTWYWKSAQYAEPKGPITAKELKQLALTNQLSRDDLVRKEGMKDWVIANRLKGLFDLPDAQPIPGRAGHAAYPAPARQPAPTAETVHHSTGMYQKGGPKKKRVNSGTPSNGSASFGQQGAGKESLIGNDYEALPTFFSFRGRMRRKMYFLQTVGISVAMIFIMIILMLMSGGFLASESIGASIFAMIFSLGGAVVLSFPFVKRLHDLNLSAWFYWIGIIPVINIFFGLYVLFARGTVGPNKYGPDPRS